MANPIHVTFHVYIEGAWHALVCPVPPLSTPRDFRRVLRDQLNVPDAEIGFVYLGNQIAEGQTLVDINYNPREPIIFSFLPHRPLTREEIQESVAALMELGYPEDRVRAALDSVGLNRDLAAELLAQGLIRPPPPPRADQQVIQINEDYADCSRAHDVLRQFVVGGRRVDRMREAIRDFSVVVPGRGEEIRGAPKPLLFMLGVPVL
jgi:hypothetical protein